MIAQLFSLEGKRVLVTGASSGIGLHIATLFARAGAAVALAARRVDRLNAAVSELTAAGHKACVTFIDVTQAETIAAAFDSVEDNLGGPIDVLFNNSGILYMKRFLEQDAAEVARIFDTNLKGAFLVAQEAGKRMAAHGAGAIINVASTAGLATGGQLASYGAAKAALIQLTKIMALELASKGIRVNAICPGNIETEMLKTFTDRGIEKQLLARIPQRRFGRPDDLDGAALLLASDAGRYITGVALPVDGGQLLSWM